MFNKKKINQYRKNPKFKAVRRDSFIAPSIQRMGTAIPNKPPTPSWLSRSLNKRRTGLESILKMASIGETTAAAMGVVKIVKPGHSNVADGILR